MVDQQPSSTGPTNL